MRGVSLAIAVAASTFLLLGSALAQEEPVTEMSEALYQQFIKDGLTPVFVVVFTGGTAEPKHLSAPGQEVKKLEGADPVTYDWTVGIKRCRYVNGEIRCD
jgi:hypothetical protein